MSSEDDWNPDDVGDEESYGGRGSMESWNPDDVDEDGGATATNRGVQPQEAVLPAAVDDRRGSIGTMSSQWLDLESTLGRVAQMESTLPRVQEATTAVPAPAREAALEMAPMAPASDTRADKRGSKPAAVVTTIRVQSTANPLTASPEPERENTRAGVGESKDAEPSAFRRKRTDSDANLVSGTSQDTVQSQVEEIGVGFYSLCTCLLMRRDVSIFKQLFWCLGSVFLMILQLISLLGLIIEVPFRSSLQPRRCFDRSVHHPRSSPLSSIR